MEADVLAYLDQLHEQTKTAASVVESGRAQAKFITIILREWPAISAMLPEHDHSL